jgi:hypothetical protein
VRCWPERMLACSAQPPAMGGAESLLAGRWPWRWIMSNDVVKVDHKEPAAKSKFPLGAAQVLNHCKDVVEAFGRPLGFIIIMTALMPGLAASVGTVVAAMKAIGKYLG